MMKTPTEEALRQTYMVARIRLPRDRSFIYLRIDRTKGRAALDVRLIPRRYYSPRRFELMRFPLEDA